MLKRRRTASPSEYHQRLGMIGIRSLLKVLQRKPEVKYIFTKDYIPYNLKEKPSVRFEMIEYLGSDEDDYR